MDPDGETAVPVDGSADQAGSEARIVASDRTEEAATHSPDVGIGGSSMDMGHSTPGWIVPAAAVGAGGGALFAFMSHDKGGDGSASSATALTSGSGAGVTGMGISDGTPGGHPSDVPEPGTILLMGAGIASFLGRRKILSR
jgi:hypothetical protein